MGSKDVINTMVTLADMMMQQEDYAQAADMYRRILELEPNEVALYNYGTLHAQGKGVKKDFLEGGYWFHQAELMGDEKAGLLCTKCMTDYLHEDFESKTPEDLYIRTLRFRRTIFPGAATELEVCRKLYAYAVNHCKKEEYTAAAKFFRAAAEYGNDGYSQNDLAVLYNNGKGVEKNDLAALYWFDKAVDNGAAVVAQRDRNGMLNAYKANFTVSEFFDEMMKLSAWCRMGSPDVPKDANKASYWRELGENYLREAAKYRG